MSINKQKLIQIALAITGACGAIALLGPQIDLLPTSWKPYGAGIVMGAYVLDKILVAANQILVEPAKIQSPATQAKLAALPDKSVPAESGAATSPDFLSTPRPSTPDSVIPDVKP